jgi:hypothetical protein
LNGLRTDGFLKKIVLFLFIQLYDLLNAKKSKTRILDLKQYKFHAKHFVGLYLETGKKTIIKG